jgi:hypothetical protein
MLEILIDQATKHHVADEMDLHGRTSFALPARGKLSQAIVPVAELVLNPADAFGKQNRIGAFAGESAIDDGGKEPTASFA